MALCSKVLNFCFSSILCSGNIDDYREVGNTFNNEDRTGIFNITPSGVTITPVLLVKESTIETNHHTGVQGTYCKCTSNTIGIPSTCACKQQICCVVVDFASIGCSCKVEERSCSSCVGVFYTARGVVKITTLCRTCVLNCVPLDVAISRHFGKVCYSRPSCYCTKQHQHK